MVSKSLVDCWVWVPRLLLGWMERVCCQLPLFAWCDRRVRLLPVS
ncbi:hypothetical protein BMETH_701_1 [methanotrophic bacterial endosymbiont of Bathymodiolus sp.]|nr:hypothetical protein BMETH_701_1 [methanotrophic bacterial endosymbiont of Bathymodiolus sp.]